MEEDTEGKGSKLHHSSSYEKQFQFFKKLKRSYDLKKKYIDWKQ